VQSASARPRALERSRVSVHESSLAHVEDAWLPPGWEIPPLCESAHQIILPYHGFFACSVGDRRCLLDANWTLCISPQKEYSIDHPLRDTGDAALIITPSPDTLDEICRTSGSSMSASFTDPLRRSSMLLRLLTQHLLRFTPEANDPLRFDECVILALREAVQSCVSPGRVNRRAAAVECAKEILHARLGERISLHDVAREVGVTPVYLTQEFTRQEGSPLYRYFDRLRLSRALVELHHCDNITALALDLGFSTHSHFTAVFHRTFGLTPSEYRSSIGSRDSAMKRLLARVGEASP